MKTGIELITEERNEQLNKHNITIKQDLAINNKAQLAEAAVRILEEPLDYRKANRPINWNEKKWLYMCGKSYEQRLIISGAFIAAELDRINHITNQS